MHVIKDTYGCMSALDLRLVYDVRASHHRIPLAPLLEYCILAWVTVN